MEGLCSLCKQPAYIDEAEHEDALIEHEIIAPQTFQVILTHKACSDAYNIACYDMHKPTFSREK